MRAITISNYQKEAMLLQDTTKYTVLNFQNLINWEVIYLTEIIIHIFLKINT